MASEICRDAPLPKSREISANLAKSRQISLTGGFRAAAIRESTTSRSDSRSARPVVGRKRAATYYRTNWLVQAEEGGLEECWPRAPQPPKNDSSRHDFALTPCIPLRHLTAIYVLWYG